MSDLEQRLAEDKALRDGALGLFKADLALVRADLTERGLGKRVADRLGTSMMEVVDEAIDYAEDNKGAVAAAMAAVVLWFARRPILAALGRLIGEDEEPEAADGRSEND